MLRAAVPKNRIRPYDNPLHGVGRQRLFAGPARLIARQPFDVALARVDPWTPGRVRAWLCPGRCRLRAERAVSPRPHGSQSCLGGWHRRGSGALKKRQFYLSRTRDQ